MAWSLQFLGYLRTLSLKFQKATSKIEVFLPLPCWLSQLNWDSQQGRDRKTSILVLAFWNFKFKVLKYQWNFRPHATVISNLVKPLIYIHFLLVTIEKYYQDWCTYTFKILTLWVAAPAPASSNARLQRLHLARKLFLFNSIPV